MARADELRSKQKSYAQALGQMVMEAASVELFLSTLALALYEHDKVVTEKVTEGRWSASRVAEYILKAVKTRPLEEPLQGEVVEEVANALRLLDKRNDMLHSAWDPGSVFEELTPEASRLALRGRIAKATGLGEIIGLEVELQRSWHRLVPLGARVAVAL